MKQRKRKGTDVPQNIRSFIDNVIAAPLEQIELPLKDFVWEFGKGDLNHWIGLFTRFDSFFNKYIRLDEESTLEEYISRSFPREAVLQILRVSRIILENCSNRHIYSSFMHFASLLSSTDDDVIESTLQTLMALTNKSGGCKSPVIRIAHLSSKLFSLAQGWGSKEGGLGLIACCIPNPETGMNGSTLHFEFYSSLNGSNGLRVIHVPDTHLFKGTDHELFTKLVEEYSVPVANKFALLTRLRFARAFESLERRYQFVCIRLYAFILLVQSGRESEDITAFFANEPEFIDELLSLLSYDEIPEKVRILGILSLAALCQDRSHQPTLLASITSGGHRTILPTILQKSIDSVLSTTCSTKWSTIFTEVLFSLLSVLVSSTQGSLALQDAGIIPTLLPLLKNTDPQNLQLVTTSLSVIEGLLDYHPPSSSLFRDLGGLDESISRLQAEVLAVESTAASSTVRGSSSRKGKEVETVQVQPLYFDTLVSNDRKALIMSLLRVISLATFAPGSTARVDGSEENLLPQCLCAIFKKGKDFGGGVFSLAAQVITDLIHKDPTCFPTLESTGLPGVFIDAIANGSGPLCSSDVVTCIPPCLDALCLNNNGLNLVKERNALKCFVKIFTSKSYLKVLTSETTALVSSGLDELLRHASSLRPFGVEMVIEILDTIAKIGPGSGSGSDSHSTVSPMETDESEKNLDQNNDVESFVQRCISNVVRLLEPIVQNLDTCRMFVEKKGVDAVLRLFDLHSVPLSPYQVHSMGVTLSGAFKNFSPTQSVSMVRIVRVFLQDKIIATNKVLDSVCEYRLLKLDPCKVEEVLRSLSSLEGLLHLGFFIVKNNAVMMAELAVSENEVLKKLAKVYAEVAWQATLIEDSVSEETKLPDTIAEEADTSTSTGTSRDDDMVSSTPTERESEVASQAIERFPDSATRSHSTGTGMGTSVDQDFASVVRTATNVHRQGRLSSMTRLRGSESRLIRHLDALHSTHSDLEGSLSALESTMSALTGAKKVPHSLVSEVQQMLNKLRATIISFLNMIVKCLPGRRRTETTLGQYSRSVLNALSQFFLSALNYDGYYSSYTVKCRYLGKVSEDMQALTFDAKRRACYSTTVNGFYVNGTLKQLLTTFEATTQLLWTIPFSSIDDKSPKFPSWLLETMQNYFKLLEYFVNSSYLLSPSAPQSAQLLVQPVSSDLSINLFPVPREPKGLVRLLHTQVLEAVLPIWKSPMLPSCPQTIISPLTTIIEHICSEIGDVKNNTHGEDQLRAANRIIPQISEATATAIVDMGFSRARAEEALRNVGSNSVELATDWLFSHPEEAVQDDVQFAQALALSLGTNNNNNTDSEEGKEDSSAEAANNVAAPVLPLDVILSVVGRLFQKNDDLVVHSLSDLLVTLCNRNKGEDGNMVVCFLIEKLKKCPVGPGTDTGELCSIVHTLALLLTGVPSTREIASTNAVVSTVLGILDLVCSSPRKGDDSSDKTMSSLLFILNNMLQGKTVISFPDRNSVKEREKEGVTVEEFFGTILGKTCGYLTEEESQRALTIVCELIKQSVPGSVMQPCFQLCARLTKIHSLSTRFIETGGLSALLSLPTSSVFSGFDTMTSVIVRHLVEDPQTLQSAFELEMKQALNGSSLISRHGARVSVRTFLTTLAPLISRDPVIFMKGATSVCRLDSSSGGRMYMGLLKDNKEKDKDNKNESTPAGRCARVQKRVPASLSLVMDRLLEIVLSYEPEIEESSDKDKSLAVAMEIDEVSNTKGKSKVDEVSEKPSGARVSLVLKLLSEIMLWYSHAVLVLLKRDSEMMQSRGTFGIVHHVLHNLLPSSSNKGCESITGNDTSGHITERAALFLVMLCNHKGEGRRRIVSEIIRAFSSFLGSSNSTSAGTSSSSSANSNGGAMVPDTKAWSLCYLVSLILSRHGGSSNSMPGLGCSPEIARAMIDGGMIESLSSLLKVIDLDHPEAPKVCNLVLKSLESLTRAANSSEHVVKPDDSMKNRTTGSAFLTIEPDSAGTEMASNEEQGVERDQQIEIQEQDRISEEDTGMDRGEEDENPREDSGLGLVRDEDLRDDDDEDEEERDEDDDDEDNDDDDDQEDAVTVIGEDHGAHMIPLAGTNLMDDDDDDFNEEQVEEEEEEEDVAPVNRFIEVTWQGGGLDNLRVSRGRGFIEIASESVGGVDQTEELFNLHRSLRNERRRQTGNSSSTTQWTVDRSGNLTGFRQPLIDRSDHRSGNLTGFRQPLNDRSDRSGNLTGFWQPLNDRSSTPLHIPSREGAVNPIARHYLDGNRIPNEGSASLFREDQLGTSNPPSQFLDFSLGMESLRIGGRSRSAWVSRWTDDGQPQTTLSASSIAQAVEDYFISEIPAVPLQTASNPNPIPEGLPNTASTTPPLINADVEMQPSSSPPPVAAGFVEEGSPPLVEAGIIEEGSEHVLPDSEQVMGEHSNRDAPMSDMDSCHAVISSNLPAAELSDAHDVDTTGMGTNSTENEAGTDVVEEAEPESENLVVVEEGEPEPEPEAGEEAENAENEIDPTFLEALPEDLRAEVLASQQNRQSGGGSGGQDEEVAAASGTDVASEEIDPEFLAALPPDIQAEVLAQQRAQRLAQARAQAQPAGQPVDMDNASIIATFPPEIREEVLLTSSEAVLSGLPSNLLAEAQLLRDRELNRYRSRGSLFGGAHHHHHHHRLGTGSRRFTIDGHHQSVMDRGVGASLVRRAVPTLTSSDGSKGKERDIEGAPLFDKGSLEAIVRLFQLAPPLSKGILQRLMFNMCANCVTRKMLVGLMVDMIRPEADGPGASRNFGQCRLYGSKTNVVYAQPQSSSGLPPLVTRRILENLTYLASSHESVADILSLSEPLDSVEKDVVEGKGKDVISQCSNTPLLLFLKLLKAPLFLRSRVHLEQVMTLLEVVVTNAVLKIDILSLSDIPSDTPSDPIQALATAALGGLDPNFSLESPGPIRPEPVCAKSSHNIYAVLTALPESELGNLCYILSIEGLPSKVYSLASEVIKKLASTAMVRRKFFSSELATLAQTLSSSAISELSNLRTNQTLGINSVAGTAILRVLQALCTLSPESEPNPVLFDLNSSLEQLWQELSECISLTESKIGQSQTLTSGGEPGAGTVSQPLPPGAQRLLPFIESFFVLCEKLQTNPSMFQLENQNSAPSPQRENLVSFARVAEKHKRLLNVFIRQNPSLLQKSLSMMLKVPRLIEFDNKRSYFRSRMRLHNDNQLSGSIRISVRRAYILEDSYNQLRLRRYQDLKGRLTVQFQGEEGIDAGGLTREWYQLLSRVIFDKGALLFTTVGNNASFQPNPNSVYQTEHLSYFKFVGRVVAKALFDGQLLDVHFTRSFYKHMLGVKVTYHDIEAVDPDYYKNLKWMLENDISDIPDMTFSMDADEEKHILYEKNDVTDYELKPGGRNLRVTEETKHEYVDLVADHILTNAIRPQINAFLEGFTELIPRDLISIFNDKELELLISGLPEIDLDDLRANAEYIGYTAASPVIQWFWEVVKGFSKEDMARLLQFVTGTSKVPLEGFKALQGISGAQRFQIHKAYGAPERLPSAHTCFNQLDLPEYNTKEQLEERLLLAIHEASEGFGFG